MRGHGGTPFGQVLMGHDDVFETQQGLGIQLGYVTGLFADHVTTQQDVANQPARRRVLGPTGLMIQFNRLANVVQEGSRNDQ